MTQTDNPNSAEGAARSLPRYECSKDDNDILLRALRAFAANRDVQDSFVSALDHAALDHDRAIDLIDRIQKSFTIYIDEDV